MDDIGRLHDLSRRFGPEAAREKRAILQSLLRRRRLPARRAELLAETVEFLRAYPDDPAVRRGAEEMAARLPAGEATYRYSWGVVRRLVELPSAEAEIDWAGFEDDGALGEILGLLLLPGEAQVLEDVDIAYPEWFAAARPPGCPTDLRFFLDLLERSGLPPRARAFLFERAELPVRYRGPAPAGLCLPGGRLAYQRGDLRRGAVSLRAALRRPPGSLRRGGRREIDLALQALCPRCLEIYPLIYASPADVRVVTGSRGLQVMLVGVRPEWRSPLESIYFFLLAKNGVPVLYGPAAAFGGVCELGINLFPEFRGGETRWLYAQLLRVIRHWLGVDAFLLVRYAMGEDNPEALRSGAFWFYRKLGFRAVNPEVERLARQEEARAAAQPGYRSGPAVLRRLSRTEAILDLSPDGRRPLRFGRLGMAQSAALAPRPGGERGRAERRAAAAVGRLLELPPAGRALRAAAPLLALIPDLHRWSRADLAALRRFVAAKDAPCEAPAARISARHRRLREALLRIGNGA